MATHSRVLIRELDDDERALLRQIAADVRRRPARTLVAREAFERVAKQLEGAAERWRGSRFTPREAS